MKYPFLIFFISLASGILLNYFLNLDISILISLIFLFLSVIFSEVLGLILVIIGIFLYGMASIYKDIKSINQPYIFIDCKVLEVPKKYRNHQKFSCYVLDSDIEFLKNEKINVIFPKKSKVYLFSEVAFFGKPKFYNDNLYVTALKDFIKVKESSIGFLFSFKEFLIENYRSNSLNRDTFALGKAIIFGERDEISSFTQKKFIETGLIHLLAISGLHIGLLVAFFIFTIRNKNIQSKVILGILPVYSIFTGMHIPVVRASFMAFLYFFGKFKDLRINSVNILFFVAFLIILISPETLFSIGFQLSFIATLGILLAIDFINISVFKLKLVNLFIQSFILSFIATIFTLPVILYYFGAFSPVSILATSFALIPLYGFIGLSVINILTGFLIEPLVKFMDFFGELFLKLVDFFYTESGYFKGFTPDIISVIIFLLVLIGIFAFRINFFWRIALIFLSLSIFLFTSKDSFEGYRIYVFEGKYKPYFVISKQNSFVVIVSDYLSKKIKNVINRANPKNIYLITKRPDNFMMLDYIPLEEDKCIENICIYKTDSGFNVKINEKFFYIKNETKIYELEKK